uniref:glycosyltransferase family 2 protein n=1 Tax=Thaumasiovibrio occultus TaxID=1891184 RepID=UPI00131BAB83|nr:glycosyltransferase [Thaumasiovibrio occultus]
MKDKPSVTVVIPSYNCLATLPQVLDSVRAQGIALEILVVDDGSSDGSQAWLATQKDVTAIVGEHQGVACARNLAIERAQGDLIAFLDADDYWQSDKLDQQLALHAANPQMAFSFTDYWYFVDGERIDRCGFADWPRFSQCLHQANIGTDNHAGKEEPLFYFEQMLPLLFTENMVGTSTVIARRDLLLQVGGFDTTLPSASDWDMWLALARLGTVGVVNLPLCDYTFMREGAISKNLDTRAAALKLILDKHRSAMRKHPLVCLRGYQRWVLALAEAKRCQGRHLTAMLTELAGFALWPHWRSLKTLLGDTRRLLMPRA